MTDCRSRLLVQTTGAFDLGLRTMVASAVGVPAALWAVRADGRRELDRLAFYRELAAQRDPALAFPAPRESAEVTETGRDGPVRTLCFESPFQAVNPALRDEYGRYRENRIAWAQHWRHADGPRPTLAVIHGFGASPYWLNSAFFALPWIYRKGYDVLLYLLPFHGVRQARAAFSGWGLFAHGPAHFNEAIAHAVHDFRMLLDHIGAPVAVTGLSLGGYVCALLASVDPRPVLAIPNAPVVDIAALGQEWFPANVVLSGLGRLRGVDLDEANAAFAVHSPLTYEPLVPHERRMIIGGLGDRLAPPSQAQALWEHWDRPRIHWFPGNHVLHAGRGEYLRDMLGFMRDNGFAP